MKKWRAGVLSLALVAAAAISATAGAGPAGPAASQAVSCKSPLKVAIVTPLTGGGGFIGNAQLSWAKYAVKTLQKQYGLKIQLVTGDTPVEQGNPPAQALAQKYVADPKVVAIIGPATSGAVASTSQTYFQAGIAHISPSASRTSLTKGNNKEGTPAFFRVIADDDIQGPHDARFMISKGAKKVVVFDFQEPYSVGLANSTQTTLRAKGATVQRESTSVRTTDFSSLVTKVPGDADFVFFPTQQPEDAQTFAHPDEGAGKAGEGVWGRRHELAGQVQGAGLVRSNFAAPINLFPYNKPIIDGWKKDNPGSDLESFGPPTYGADTGRLQRDQQGLQAGGGTINQRRESSAT